MRVLKQRGLQRCLITDFQLLTLDGFKNERTENILLIFPLFNNKYESIFCNFLLKYYIICPVSHKRLFFAEVATNTNTDCDQTSGMYGWIVDRLNKFSHFCYKYQITDEYRVSYIYCIERTDAV